MKSVVIIDDDEIFLFLSSKALENGGVTEEIRKFNESDEGLHFLLKVVSDDDYPTALLVDINMPLIDGWKIVETLERERWECAKNCKTFILSSSIDSKDKEKALSYKSVAGFVTKPLSESAVREIASQHFGIPPK